MAQDFATAKIICDPLWGLIDITDYVPMVDVPEFQALGFKQQLGVTNFLFPSATHTRKQHSFGAFHRTQQLGERWMRYGMITADEARTMSAFALWHDIGHGPFSHVVEEVTCERFGRNHDQNGALIIERLKPAVEKAGVDFAALTRMFSHENPLYRGVHDKNLGAEKLDYLARDAYYTVGEMPGVEYLAYHTFWDGKELVIDEKAVDQAKFIQEFYVKMYKNVYLRKNSSIAQRLVQKMTAELLRANPIAEDAFWALTDFGLLGHFETSPVETVRAYYGRFMRRELPKTAIIVCPERFAAIDKSQGKPQTVFGVNDTVMQGVVDAKAFASPSALEQTEADIERMAKLPAGSVVVVPPSSVERFVPQDVAILLPGGSKVYLSNYFANHFHALREEGWSYTMLRVCVFPEYREALSKGPIAREVRDYLLKQAGVTPLAL